MDILIRFIAEVVFMLIGAGDIYFAIDNFNRKRYFLFGVGVMAAVSASAMLIKASFTL
jgi:hypothetical protein